MVNLAVMNNRSGHQRLLHGQASGKERRLATRGRPHSDSGLGNGPASRKTSQAKARSSTRRAMGPIAFSRARLPTEGGRRPSSGTAPLVGRRPAMPQKTAGSLA
jgi:hypothetical protein